MKFVTFNIRCDFGQDGANNFIYRRPLILEKIRQEKPDIIGFQEVLPHVAAWLKENLTEYYIAGCGREKDLTGEKLVSTVSGLLAEPGRLAAMGRNARTLSVDDSLDRIADALMKLVKTP